MTREILSIKLNMGNFKTHIEYPHYNSITFIKYPTPFSNTFPLIGETIFWSPRSDTILQDLLFLENNLPIQETRLELYIDPKA